MALSEPITRPIGQTLLVAAALGESLGTLLGPTGAMKMVYRDAHEGGEHETISSNPMALLQALDVVHPVGSLVFNAFEGMEAAYGTGLSSLVTLCGTLSTACRRLQGEGVPERAILHGIRVAEDLCIDLLRELPVRTTDAVRNWEGGHGHQEDQRARNHLREDCQQQPRARSCRNISVSFLTSLAASLQHSASCEDNPETIPEQVRAGVLHKPHLSLPASLAVSALAALQLTIPYDKDVSGSNVADLTRVRTRLVVGPDSGSSFVAPAAAVVEVSPWERVPVQAVFAQRNGIGNDLPQDRTPVANLKFAADQVYFSQARLSFPPLAIATIRLAAIAVVLGDVSASAGASSAATNQTRITHVLRSSEALLSRSAGSSTLEEVWAEEASCALRGFGVEALVVTGEVCTPLRQALASGGVMLLSEVSYEEAEAVALAVGATPIPGLEVLTEWDVGRGLNGECDACACGHNGKPNTKSSSRDCCGVERAGCVDSMLVEGVQCTEARQTRRQSPPSFDYHRKGDEHQHNLEARACPCQWAGIYASLFEAGVSRDDQSTFVPNPSARDGLGLHNPDLLVLFHQMTGERADVLDGRRGAEVTCRKAQIEAGTKRPTNAVVIFCGPLPSACEELRHRFWRVTRRVIGALSEGLVLPGAGASEVACAANLELHATRRESENIRKLERTAPKDLFTPMVLRSVAAALDEFLLTCTENAGYPTALRRLFSAKKSATIRLMRHDRRSISSGWSTGAHGALPSRSYLDWGFCPDLAVVSVAGNFTGAETERSLEPSGGDLSSDANDVKRPPRRLEEDSCEECSSGAGMVLDNFGAKVGYLERAFGIVALLVGTDGVLLAPSTS